MAGSLSITDANGATTTTMIPARLLAELERQATTVTSDLAAGGYSGVTLADVARILIELQVAQILDHDDEDDTALSA
jgi:hypothetical protein